MLAQAPVLMPTSIVATITAKIFFVFVFAMIIFILSDFLTLIFLSGTLAYIIASLILKIKRHFKHEKMCTKCLLTNHFKCAYAVGAVTIML